MDHFRIGEWTARPERNELEGPQGTVRVEPRVMHVLVALAVRAGDVVSREELLRTVWDGAFVGDEVLTNAIRQLRKALSDDAKSPRYVQTVPKKGYRLVAPVRAVADRPRRNQLTWLTLTVVVVLAVLLWGNWPAKVTTPPTVTRVTTFEGEERAPALSPDGTRVAFSRFERGGETYHLYVTTVGGGDAVRVSDTDNADYPSWSPDGEWIAFSRGVYVNGSWLNELRVVRALGGDERVVAVTRGWYEPLDWSPDGKWLAAADRESGDEANAIYLYPVVSGQKRKLTHPPTAADNESGDVMPEFSRDGTMIAFVRGWHEPPHREAIYVQPVDGGGGARRITFSDSDIRDYDWLPDGRGFVVSDRARLYSARTPRPLAMSRTEKRPWPRRRSFVELASAGFCVAGRGRCTRPLSIRPRERVRLSAVLR